MKWEDVLKIPATSPKQKIHREFILQMLKTNHLLRKKRRGGEWPGVKREKVPQNRD